VSKRNTTSQQDGQDERTVTERLLGACNADTLLPLLDLLAHPHGLTNVTRFAKRHEFMVVHCAAVVRVKDFGNLFRLLCAQLKAVTTDTNSNKNTNQTKIRNVDKNKKI